MSSRILVVTAALCACVCLDLAVPAAANAQESGSQEAYRALVQEALREFEQRNWPEARALFRRAHAIAPSARTLRGLGMVSYEMRDYPQAVRDLSAALESTERPLSPSQREELSPLLDRASGFVARYALRLTPEGASVELDGEPALLEPDGTLLVGLGEHRLRVASGGHEPEQLVLSVEGGEREILEVQLLRDKAPEPEEAAEALPSADQVFGPAPVSAPAVDARSLRWTWVALGASAAFGGAAAALWYTGAGRLDDLQRDCDARIADGEPACTADSVDTSRVETHQLLTNVGLGLSGAALLTAAGLAFFEWPRDERRSTTLRLGPGGASVKGSF